MVRGPNVERARYFGQGHTEPFVPYTCGVGPTHQDADGTRPDERHDSPCRAAARGHPAPVDHGPRRRVRAAHGRGRDRSVLAGCRSRGGGCDRLPRPVHDRGPDRDGHAVAPAHARHGSARRRERTPARPVRARPRGLAARWLDRPGQPSGIPGRAGAPARARRPDRIAACAHPHRRRRPQACERRARPLERRRAARVGGSDGDHVTAAERSGVPRRW